MSFTADEFEYPAYDFVFLPYKFYENISSKSNFELGDFVFTPGVYNKMAENTAFSDFVAECTNRHIKCDWGDMPDGDKKMNDDAVRTYNDRIFSAYENKEHPDWRIWIITEWDRSVTTVLFPDEY